ncbi:MAG: M20/M25/M40 family metallo-hydrolase [Myxococcota bacterium]
MLLLVVACAHPGPSAPAADPAAEAAAIVAWLADDAREGRGVGSAGLEAAGDWIAARYGEIGLLPGGDAGGWFQTFQVTTGVALGDGPNRLAVGEHALALRQDFLPASFSSQGAFAGKAAFVGYGISAPDLGYDDWAGVDVAGRVVVMMRYEPRERDPASPFAGDKPSHHSELRLKAHLAREKGAVALLLVEPPDGAAAEPALALKGRGPESEAGLPCVSITRATAERILGAGALAEAHAGIDADLKPRSRLVDVEVAGAVTLARTRSPTRNVVGHLPGRGALAGEAVVIGAHYDHLGRGGPGSGSLRPDSEAVHNGADDNASGVAGMLLAARRLAADGEGDRRAIWFVAFAAEEVGVRGSAHFVKDAPVPVDKVVAMLNLDMVGNLDGDGLTVLGSESAEEWPAVLAAAGTATGLSPSGKGDGYGPSDQTPFYAAGVPVLHFFTGAHARYHTPDDDAGAVNAAGVARVSALVAEVAERVAEAPARPTWKKPSSAASMAGDSRGRGASLGTVPDYAQSDDGGGVLLSGVRAGTPAEGAGLRAGDRIVGLGGRAVDNLYDLTYALQAFAPGDEVEVVWRRDGQEHRAKVTLAARGQAPPVAHPSAPARRWTIDETGVGAVRVGEPIPAGEATVARYRTRLYADAQPLEGFELADPPVLATIRGPYETFGYDHPGEPLPAGMAEKAVAKAKRAKVEMIVVTDPAVGTAEGLHVGSTFGEVRAAWPDAKLTQLPGLWEEPSCLVERGRLVLFFAKCEGGKIGDDERVIRMVVRD